MNIGSAGANQVDEEIGEETDNESEKRKRERKLPKQCFVFGSCLLTQGMH